MLEKLDIIYKKILDGLILTMFSIMFLVTLVNVFARFVLNSPISWSAELARYSFIWIIFLGAALAVRNRSHIGLEIVYNLLPDAGKKILKIAINCSFLVFLSIFIVYGIRQAILGLHTESSAMQVSMFIPYLALPIGGLFMVVEVIKVMKSEHTCEETHECEIEEII